MPRTRRASYSSPGPFRPSKLWHKTVRDARKIFRHNCASMFRRLSMTSIAKASIAECTDGGTLRYATIAMIELAHRKSCDATPENDHIVHNILNALRILPNFACSFYHDAVACAPRLDKALYSMSATQRVDAFDMMFLFSSTIGTSKVKRACVNTWLFIVGYVMDLNDISTLFILLQPSQYAVIHIGASFVVLHNFWHNLIDRCIQANDAELATYLINNVMPRFLGSDAYIDVYVHMYALTQNMPPSAVLMSLREGLKSDFSMFDMRSDAQYVRESVVRHLPNLRTLRLWSLHDDKPIETAVFQYTLDKGDFRTLFKLFDPVKFLSWPEFTRAIFTEALLNKHTVVNLCRVARHHYVCSCDALQMTQRHVAGLVAGPIIDNDAYDAAVRRFRDHHKSNVACPITQEVILQPMLDRNGIAFEFDHISRWLLEHATHPITREPVVLNDFHAP